MLEFILILWACYALWFAFARPEIGLLLMFVSNPVDSFVPLPEGLSIGRIFGFFAVLGWLWRLNRGGGVLSNLAGLRCTKLVSPFIATIWIATLLNQPGLTNILRCLSVSLLAIMCLMVEELFRYAPRKISRMLWVIALSAAITAAWPVAERFGIDLPGAQKSKEAIGQGDEVRSAGIDPNPNGSALILNTAIFLLTMFLLQARSLRRALLIASTIGFTMLATILTGSRTHFVGMLVYFFFLGFLRLKGPRRGLFKFSLGSITALVILSSALAYAPDFPKARILMSGDQAKSNAARRIDFSKAQRQFSYDLMFEKPIFGVGLGNFINCEVPGIRQADAHDTISATLGETGVLGAMTLTLIFLVTALRVYAGVRRNATGADMNAYYYTLVLLAILGSMVISGLGGYVLFYQRLFWVIVGLASLIGVTPSPDFATWRTPLPAGPPRRPGLPVRQANHNRTSDLHHAPSV
jgi:hypothetical protein